MRLCILSDTAAPHTRRWARWFANRGHEVHVISLNPHGLKDYEPAIVHSIWKPHFGNAIPERILKIPIVLIRLHELLKQYPPDVVHAHSAGGYAWMAMLSGFRPYVITPWGTDLLIDIQYSRINRWLTTQALRHAAMITTDGFHFVEILHGLGVPRESVFIHTFGTDINRFCPGPAKEERDKLNIGDSPIIISTRTLNPVHDVETFIRALPYIRECIPTAQFIIVGDGSERLKLEKLSEDLGVDTFTHFTGMVDENRMCSLLRASDIYVSTSKMDAGLAGSTAEAMALELPVVQTKNSDNEYWTPDGEGGYLVPNSDPDALALAVCKLIMDASLRRKMGIRNRQKIIKEYNMDKEMSRIEMEYERIIQEWK